jgi:hypothetical protein
MKQKAELLMISVALTTLWAFLKRIEPLFDYEGLLYAIILRETLNWMSLSKTTKSEG